MSVIIIIKGMEMPKSCFNCRCPRACRAINRRIDEMDRTEWFPQDHRHSDCPFIEVPESHGRLIDADKLKETLDYYISEAGWSDEINKALSWVKDEFIDSEQTVITASEE